MPKPQPPPEIPSPSRDEKIRRSLQPKSLAETTNPSVFRHTRSQNYDRPKKVKTRLPPVIQEDSPDEDNSRPGKVSVAINKTVINLETSRKISKASRRSAQSTSSKPAGELVRDAEKNGSTGNLSTRSDNSIATNSVKSSRNPSVQSLQVVREQYCCCSRWTGCERALFATVGVLIFIILILIIVIALVASGSDDDITNTVKKALSIK